MRSNGKDSSTESQGFSGIELPSPEENFRPELFGEIAKLVWPKKTDFTLAEIADATDRQAREWIAGRVPPPGIVLAALMTEIMRRPRKHRRQ